MRDFLRTILVKRAGPDCSLAYIAPRQGHAWLRVAELTTVGAERAGGEMGLGDFNCEVPARAGAPAQC